MLISQREHVRSEQKETTAELSAPGVTRKDDSPPAATWQSPAPTSNTVVSGPLQPGNSKNATSQRPHDGPGAMPPHVTASDCDAPPCGVAAQTPDTNGATTSHFWHVADLHHVMFPPRRSVEHETEYEPSGPPPTDF